jgi:hypothetical protein
MMWARQCWLDLTSVKPGMTRGEIEQRLRRDGGLQGRPHTRYVHPRCCFFKIGVQYELSKEEPGEDRSWPKSDKALKVSTPVLEHPTLD